MFCIDSKILVPFGRSTRVFTLVKYVVSQFIGPLKLLPTLIVRDGGLLFSFYLLEWDGTLFHLTLELTVNQC